MTCFDRAGVKVPKGPGRCVCGEFVRFDIATKRVEHFLACPVVDRKVTKAQAPLAAKMANVDPATIAMGYQLAQRLGLTD